jgi:hypothetical protein
MATEKTTRLEALVFSRMGPFTPEAAPGDVAPDWVQATGHLRAALLNATPETEGYALGLATGPLWAWGLATLDEIQAVIDGAPFLAPPAEASVVALGASVETKRRPDPRPKGPDAAELDEALETFRADVGRALGEGR